MEELRPKEKVYNHLKEKKNSVLQNMLSQPFEPPCMVFEKQ